MLQALNLPLGQLRPCRRIVEQGADGDRLVEQQLGRGGQAPLLEDNFAKWTKGLRVLPASVGHLRRHAAISRAYASKMPILRGHLQDAINSRQLYGMSHIEIGLDPLCLATFAEQHKDELGLAGPKVELEPTLGSKHEDGTHREPDGGQHVAMGVKLQGEGRVIDVCRVGGVVGLPVRGSGEAPFTQRLWQLRLETSFAEVFVNFNQGRLVGKIEDDVGQGVSWPAAFPCPGNGPGALAGEPGVREGL